MKRETGILLFCIIIIQMVLSVLFTLAHEKPPYGRSIFLRYEVINKIDRNKTVGLA